MKPKTIRRKSQGVRKPTAKMTAKPKLKLTRKAKAARSAGDGPVVHETTHVLTPDGSVTIIDGRGADAPYFVNLRRSATILDTGLPLNHVEALLFIVMFARLGALPAGAEVVAFSGVSGDDALPCRLVFLNGLAVMEDGDHQLPLIEAVRSGIEGLGANVRFSTGTMLEEVQRTVPLARTASRLLEKLVPVEMLSDYGATAVVAPPVTAGGPPLEFPVRGCIVGV